MFSILTAVLLAVSPAVSTTKTVQCQMEIVYDSSATGYHWIVKPVITMDNAHQVIVYDNSPNLYHYETVLNDEYLHYKDAQAGELVPNCAPLTVLVKAGQ